VLWPEGSVHWLSAFGRVRYDRKGNPVGITGVVANITGRKKAEEALRESRDTLELQVRHRTAEMKVLSEKLRELARQLTETENKERARIAGLLHDDLQQLLVGAKVKLELSAGKTTPVVKQNLEKSLDFVVQALRMSRTLTEELLPPVLGYDGRSTLVQWVCDFMRETYGLDVHSHFEDEVVIRDREIRLLLLQALRELLFNVVKHSGVKSAQVLVSKGKGCLQIAVKDQGTGFEPRDYTASHNRGKGLGLFSIQERLSHLGGHLDVQTAPGHGTTCTLMVPVQDMDQSEEKDEEHIPPPAHEAQKDTGGHVRVMLVDDHSFVREGFFALLEGEEGITVVGEAEDGEKAIERVLELVPDVILMDINMPVKDGIEATRAIKTLLPNIRIIGLSIDDSKPTVEAMKAAGASGLLSKASTSEEVVAAIRNANYGFRLIPEDACK